MGTDRRRRHRFHHRPRVPLTRQRGFSTRPLRTMWHAIEEIASVLFLVGMPKAHELSR